jgi:putative DNA primase/helicase
MSEEPVLEGEGRNNFLYRAGRSMHAKGYPEAAIRAALDETNRARCRPSVTPGEFESILESVLTGADRPDFQKAQEPRERGEIKTLTARALLDLKIAPREFVLDPVLRERETAMLWAWRGTGKTYVGLAMAYAIASGGKVLRWSAPRPRRVLYVDGELTYVDGELTLPTVQERIALLVASSELELPSDDYFKIVTPDVQEMTLPNLSSREAQQALERVLADVEVLFIDSISTLCRSGRENDSEDWLPVQEWALRLRQCGKTVVFVHHAGKGGSQRATSRREDVFDLSVRLARPQDYSPDEGARFEVHFEKARTILGDAVKPFEARLVVANGRAEWQMRDLEDALLARAASLFRYGATVRDAAEELNISKSAAQRLRSKAAERGLLSDAN